MCLYLNSIRDLVYLLCIYLLFIYCVSTVYSYHFYWGGTTLLIHFVPKAQHNVLLIYWNEFYSPINPCSPEGFSQNICSEGGCCNPLWIINTECYKTLNLQPVYRYGHPLSIDTKISTNQWRYAIMWARPRKLRNCHSVCIGTNWFFRNKT